MQLFIADATLFLIFSPHETMKKTALKMLIIGPFFFNNANRPKSSPFLNSCSIKISHDFGLDTFLKEIGITIVVKENLFIKKESYNRQIRKT